MDDVIANQDPSTLDLSRYPDPYERLTMALLIRSIRDFFAPERNVRRSARKWLNSRSIEPYGARWCCAYLSLDYNVLLDRLEDHGNEVQRALLEHARKAQ